MSDEPKEMTVEQAIAATEAAESVLDAMNQAESEPASIDGDKQPVSPLGLIGEGDPTPTVEGPIVEQSAPIETYPVDSDIWGPVNAAFCELCKRYGLPKGHQDVAFDRKTGSFVIRDRPVE